MTRRNLSVRVASKKDAEAFAKGFGFSRVPGAGEEIVSHYSERLGASITHLESPDPETGSQYRLAIFRMETSDDCKPNYLMYL